ncbi:MAG: hypothetical protein Q8S08_12955 [Halomonas sp.]|nr:hypothetical protein [Halomonas sp.]MDP3536287.1 hypothetical protein [Halomonas sp.]
MSLAMKKAAEELLEKGVKVTGGENAYKLLYKLAKSHGHDMNGSKSAIARAFGLSPKEVMKMSRTALDNYLETGVLVVPGEFLYRRRKIYRHDGDAGANRNLWRSSNTSWRDKYREEPVTYSSNTSKG